MRWKKLILTPGQRPRTSNKFNRKKVYHDGYWFDSQLEANHYKKLALLQRARVIGQLEVHKSYPLVINGVKVGKITPDFTFLENGVRKFHECKNPVTRALSGFRFKVFEALYGVEVEYVMKPSSKFVPFKGFASTNRGKKRAQAGTDRTPETPEGDGQLHNEGDGGSVRGDTQRDRRSTVATEKGG